MSWNDGLERKKFERRWSKDEKAYREAGMTEEQILSIREMEEEQFRSNRRYQMHTQPLNPSDFGDGNDDEQEDKSVLFNQKGGVGKTTTSFNLGVWLARMGKKVLLIDCDPHETVFYTIIEALKALKIKPIPKEDEKWLKQRVSSA